MDFKSSSVIFLYTNQGIGGNNGRVLSNPLYFPSRNALINCSSFQLPIPVASLVRFAAYDWPHGHNAEVKSGANIIHPFSTSFISGFGNLKDEGAPDNLNSGIISGSCLPIRLGE
jgi:hypothetical protein